MPVTLHRSLETDSAARQFDALIVPHLDEAYTLARYLLRDEHDAQDIVQEAALRALRHIAGLRRADARAWLLSIVRNCCYTFTAARGAERSRVSETVEQLELPDERSADERAVRSSERARIETALAQLPMDLREVVILREISDLSYKEIAEVAGVPMGTVMSRLARARERLASLLGEPQ